jgi:hypothetical protein
VNKYLAGTTPLTISVTNFAGAGTAQVWQINSSNVIAQLPDLTYANGALQTSVPSPSVTLLVVPPGATSPPLQLQAGPASASGQFEFSVKGQTGTGFVLQSSTDLSHWTTIGSNTLVSTNATFQFSAGSTAQFYRTVLTP